MGNQIESAQRNELDSQKIQKDALIFHIYF